MIHQWLVCFLFPFLFPIFISRFHFQFPFHSISCFSICPISTVLKQSSESPSVLQHHFRSLVHDVHLVTMPWLYNLEHKPFHLESNLMGNNLPRLQCQKFSECLQYFLAAFLVYLLIHKNCMEVLNEKEFLCYQLKIRKQFAKILSECLHRSVIIRVKVKKVWVNMIFKVMYSCTKDKMSLEV